MKEFFKSLMASILGCFIVLGIFFFLMIASLAAMMVTSEPEFKLKDNTVLTLNMQGVLSDRVTPNPLAEIFGQSEESEMGLDDVLASIKKAKQNDKIKGIYIKAGAFSASNASLKEIRDELLDFKTSGKFVVAYGDTYTQGCYYLATVADKVIINPQGNLDLHGLSSSPTFYKGLLEKVGVEMQIFKVGTFKSAVEPFILDKMSEANRAQVTSYLNDMWGTIKADISQSRNISVADIDSITNTFPLLSEASNYVDKKLVDTLMYETDVKTYLKTLLKIDADKDMRTASVKNMTTVPLKNADDSDNIIAVLYAEGSIYQSGSDEITSDMYVKEIEKLKNDDDVKAVVFRVNSPGGSAYASEQIWKAITELKEKKPIVVSMGDYAASGGYYISCSASKIVAQPNTLTGSIGIFGMFPNFEGLTQKVGLTYDNVKTNTYADFGTVIRPMRADEKAVLQTYIERGYDLFLTRCSEGRGIPKDSLDLIAQGRVWTGNQALQLGLVDAIGGVNKAIEEAANLAQLSDFSLKSYPRKKDFFESFFGNKQEEMTTRAMKEYLGADYETFMLLREIKTQDFIQSRLPYDFNVN